MDFKYTVLPILFGLVFYFILKVLVKIPGKALQRKFVSLGDMSGMSKSQIIAKCGQFKTIQNIEGGSICVWSATGYLITLVFDNEDKCLRVSNETIV
tara:strand:- start:128 stop:418 length:291 start_codon:yes stop_codon:yes gene_type:complete